MYEGVIERNEADRLVGMTGREVSCVGTSKRLGKGCQPCQFFVIQQASLANRPSYMPREVEPVLAGCLQPCHASLRKFISEFQLSGRPNLPRTGLRTDGYYRIIKLLWRAKQLSNQP